MKVTEQIDALRMSGVLPIDYLIVPRFKASIIMTTVLVVLAAGVAYTTGMLTGYTFFDINPRTFVNMSMVDKGDLTIGLTKCVAYGAAIPVVSGYEVKGKEVEGVFTLHTVADAHAMLKRAATAKSLVVIGGGILGIEAGNGLRKRGLQVAVVGRNKRLLPKQMDPPGAVFLQRRLEEMGFTFYLGVTPREIARLNGRLAVRLEDGTALETDMVLLSAGAAPNLTLARQLGLEIGKAVQVDDRLRTSLDDIYAAGDLVEDRGVYYGIWPMGCVGSDPELR